MTRALSFQQEGLPATATLWFCNAVPLTWLNRSQEQGYCWLIQLQLCVLSLSGSPLLPSLALVHVGVCSLKGSASSMAKVARWTFMYYAATTVAAVLLGIVLVTLLNPGRGSPLDGDVTNCSGAEVLQPLQEPCVNRLL